MKDTEQARKKLKLYQKEKTLFGHTLSQDGIRPKKNRRNQRAGTPHKHQNLKIPSRRHSIFRKVQNQPSRENRQHETTTQERNKMGLDDRPKYGF